jgi:hypothetical protein
MATSIQIAPPWKRNAVLSDSSAYFIHQELNKALNGFGLYLLLFFSFVPTLLGSTI